MTTLIYSKEQQAIAIDGRVTAGGRVVTDNDSKFSESGGKFYFLTGCASAANRLIKAIDDGFKQVDIENEWDCILMTSDTPPMEIRVNNEGFIEFDPVTEEVRGLGSGSDFAISAIDMGKTVKEAIKYAATRDIYTGGKITVYDLKKGKFR